MSKITFTGFALLLLLFLGNSSVTYAAASTTSLRMELRRVMRLRRPRLNPNKEPTVVGWHVSKNDRRKRQSSRWTSISMA